MTENDPAVKLLLAFCSSSARAERVPGRLFESVANGVDLVSVENENAGQAAAGRVEVNTRSEPEMIDQFASGLCGHGLSL